MFPIERFFHRERYSLVLGVVTDHLKPGNRLQDSPMPACKMQGGQEAEGDLEPTLHVEGYV